MRRAAPGALALALVAFLVVAVAPAVLAGAMAPEVTLRGPSSADLNANVRVGGAVVNTNGGEGAMYVVVQQRFNKAWRVIAKAKPRWTDGDTGTYVTTIKVKDPAMSLCRYRAVWEAGGVKGYSKTLVIAVQ
jgi:hypothetical protein